MPGQKLKKEIVRRMTSGKLIAAHVIGRLHGDLIARLPK
jgi:hypothetical protein